MYLIHFDIKTTPMPSKMQSSLRLQMYCICAVAVFALVSISSFRLKEPRIELKAFDISKIYAKDVADGEKVIKGMEGHISDPVMTKMLKDPEMRETFAAAIGSDLNLKVGNKLSSSLASAAIADLGYHGKTSAASKVSRIEPLNVAKPKSAQSAPTKAAAPVVSLHLQKQQSKALHTAPHPAKKTGPTLQIAYDAFAPGVIDGATASAQSSHSNKDTGSKETAAPSPSSMHAAKSLFPIAVTAGPAPAAGSSASSAAPAGKWLRDEVKQISTAAAQLQAQLKSVSSKLHIQPPPSDLRSICSPDSTILSSAMPSPAHVHHLHHAHPSELTTFASVLEEAHRLRLDDAVHPRPAPSHSAQTRLRSAVCEGPAAAAAAHSRRPQPHAVTAAAAASPPRRPLACALPLLAEALGGVACTEDERPAAGLDRGSRGPSFLRALDSVGLGDDAVGMGSPVLRGATLASLSPEQARRPAPPLSTPPGPRPPSLARP
jgi:hypothetical protein